MRLGRIGYINCYPVYAGLDRGVVRVPAELVTGTPPELNDLLSAGARDVSASSAVEYARHANDLVLLPALAISGGGPRGFLASRDWGRALLGLLAADASRATGVSLAACREYFAGLDYALSCKHLACLTDFFRRLVAAGVVPDGALQFLHVA